MRQNQVLLVGILVAIFGVAGIYLVNSYIAKPEDRAGTLEVVEEYSAEFSVKGKEFINDELTDFFVDVNLDNLNNQNPLSSQ